MNSEEQRILSELTAVLRGVIMRTLPAGADARLMELRCDNVKELINRLKVEDGAAHV